jgi:lysyl-tRNA synthetase, class II
VDVSPTEGVLPDQVARWVARLVQLAGLIDIVSVVMPASRVRIRLMSEILPVAGVRTAGAATAAVGLLLVVLGNGLRRRKRRAWYVATGLAGASVVLNLAKGLDIDGALVSVGLLALLIAARGAFRAAADPGSRWRALAAVAGFSAAGIGLGLAEIAARESWLVGNPPFSAWLSFAALGLVGVSGSLRFAHPETGDLVSLTTGLFGLLAVGSGLLLLLRPGAPRPVRTAADERQLRDLLARHGEQDSLGYFSLRRDKSLIWSPSGKAAVAYRVVRGVSLAAGDPIGDPEAWPGAIRAWLEEARQHAWVPAVLGCGETGARVYRRHGLDALELGDEAVVEVAQFTLDGRPMRAVRQAVGRVERAGYPCQIGYQRDLPEWCVAAATQAADRLRDGDVERGFSMALSRVGDPADSDCLLALAWDAGGQLRAMLQFVPWGDDGISLDLMRRDRTSDNGLIEYLVVSVLRQAPALGIRRVSLNFAVLRWVLENGQRLGAGPVLRGWRRLLIAASRFWQIETLYRANAKYRPCWRPRYLCYPTARDLPRIGLAALIAEAFIVPPRPRRRPRRPSTEKPLEELAAAPAAGDAGGRDNAGHGGDSEQDGGRGQRVAGVAVERAADRPHRPVAG